MYSGQNWNEYTEKKKYWMKMPKPTTCTNICVYSVNSGCVSHQEIQRLTAVDSGYGGNPRIT